MTSLNASTVPILLDDFSPAFSYATPSNWFSPDTSPRGFPNGDSYLSQLVDGTYHATSTVNASVVLTFTGPSISLMGVSGPSAGYYSIQLDAGTSSAVTVPTLSAYSPTNATYELWSASSLSLGQHTVQITNLGAHGNTTVGSELVIDYAKIVGIVGATGATLTNTTVDNTSPSLQYTSTWNSNNDTRFIDGSSSFTNVNGGSVSLTFTGSAVYVYGDTVDDHGIFRATLDGVTTTYNAQTPVLKIGTLLFHASNLNSTSHTLTLTNDAGTTTTETFFDLDAIIYTTPSQYYTAFSASTSSSSSAGSSTSRAGTSTGSSPASTSTSSSAPAATTSKPGRASNTHTLGRTYAIAVLVIGLLSLVR